MRLSHHVFCVSIILFLSSNSQLYSQVEEAPADSLIIMPAEPVSKRKKKGNLNYRSFFRDKTKSPEAGQKKLNQASYEEYEGKIIRNIFITTLDPIDYTIEGDSNEALSFLSRATNTLHLKTQEKVVRNLILIEEDQPFDSLLVKESERLVRSQSYVRDVTVVLIPVSSKSDSVDVQIYVLDQWSIVPRISSSSTTLRFDLIDKNLVGSGHETSNTLSFNKQDADAHFMSTYYIPSIGNSYINARMQYGADEFKNNTQSISFERPFFSPLTEWAGGIDLAVQYRTDPKHVRDSVFELSTYRLNSKDFWMGKTFRIYPKGHLNERTHKLFATGRLADLRYIQMSNESFDSLMVHSDEKIYLASIGFSARRYKRDRYIFDYGITEDVPIGSLFSITLGNQYRNNLHRTYAGMRLSWGNYIKTGYLSASLEYGTFFNRSRADQGAIFLYANYFTDLIELGSWKFRQFVKTETTIGIRREIYEQLNLNDFYVPSAFSNFKLEGTSKVLLTLQSQFYAPFSILGFRFAPFVVYSIGMIGQQDNRFLDNRFYSQIGLGVLVNNLNLVFNTFQISIAFYPSLPDGRINLLGINPFRSTDFGFSNFDPTKPSKVLFE
jgi:hypothetical protein